jgi:glycosyltransferase involved in cell wall biosynthesis
MLKDLAVVGFKFRHHGRYSGYHQIVQYLSPTVYLDRGKFDFTTPLFNFSGGSRVNQVLEKARDHRFFRDLYKVCHNPKIRVIHFLYPENTLAHCPFEIPEDKLVIGTLHQPQSYFRDIFESKNKNKLAIKNYQRCNRAIVLSRGEVDGVKSITGIKEVFFIPHGLDTQRFKPSIAKRKEDRILFLGNWLRDFHCAAGVFTILSRINPSVIVTVVCNSEYHKYFRGISNVECLSNITDDHLLDLLQTYTLLFLPLKSATANNALVEAAACGLPIFTTDLGSIADYIPLSDQMKFPLHMHGDHNELANRVLVILDLFRKRLEDSNQLKEFTLGLSWDLIARKTVDVYK